MEATTHEVGSRSETAAGGRTHAGTHSFDQAAPDFPFLLDPAGQPSKPRHASIDHRAVGWARLGSSRRIILRLHYRTVDEIENSKITNSPPSPRD